MGPAGARLAPEESALAEQGTALDAQRAGGEPEVDEPTDSPQQQAPAKAQGRRRWLPLLARLGSLAVVGVLTYVFWGSIEEAALASLDIGWSFFWLFPLFVLWSLAAALGWHDLLKSTPRSSMPSLLRLLIIRIEVPAINLVVPVSGLGGDVLRAALTSTDEGQQSSTPPVILDRIAVNTAEGLAAIAGLAVFAATEAVVPWHLLVALGLIVALAIVLAGWRPLVRLVLRWGWLQRRKQLFATLRILESNGRYRWSLPRSVGWHLLERALITGEIWLIALLLGLDFGPGDALFVTAVASIFSLALFFVPAQIGAFEGGFAYAFAVLGLGATAGLSVALVRRGRQLAVAAVGFALLTFYERLGRQR